MDPFTVQKMVKENTEDVSTYLRDLKNWEADIKKKDAELRGISPEEEELYPEIRSKTIKPKLEDANKIPEGKKSQKNEKIFAFDYKSCDNLDVEKMCGEIDSKEEEKKREVAMYEKEKGNDHVKVGNWDKAVSCYSRAIRAYPNDAIFFANRGLCHLKLKDFQKAESDCTKAINLDTAYVKAWLRRSAAWEGLGKLELAKRDLKRVLSLEPRNAEAQMKISTLEKKIKDLGGLSSEEIAVVEGSCSKEEGILSAVSCKRTETYIIENPEQDREGHSSIIDLLWKDYKGEIIQPVQKAPHLRSKKLLRRVPVEVFGNGPSLMREDGGAVVNAFPANRTSELSSMGNGVSIERQGNHEALEPPLSHLPPPPKSSVQFLMDWKGIKMHQVMAALYLKQIPPESLPTIFGDSLEITILEEMLNIMGQKLLTSTSPVHSASPEAFSTYEFLRNLSCVPRFSTLSMFLSSEEKIISRELLAHCAKIGECSTEEAADLAGKFML